MLYHQAPLSKPCACPVRRAFAESDRTGLKECTEAAGPRRVTFTTAFVRPYRIQYPGRMLEVYQDCAFSTSSGRISRNTDDICASVEPSSPTNISRRKHQTRQGTNLLHKFPGHIDTRAASPRQLSNVYIKFSQAPYRKEESWFSPHTFGY